MSRRVDFETILKDKFFLFQGEKTRHCSGYSNRIRTKYTAKWGVQIVRMIFQTRSNTTKVRQAYGRNSICLPHFFIDSFILLLFCTVRFLRICILLFGCIRIVCCAGCFRCAVIGLFYALTWHIC
mgnify:CR=1 FL=1